MIRLLSTANWTALQVTPGPAATAVTVLLTLHGVARLIEDKVSGTSPHTTRANGLD